MRYEILNDQGEVINTIVASQAFVDANYPNHRQVPGPAVSKDEINAPIIAQIVAIEAGQMRGLRECLLTGDKAGLQLIDDKVKALRAKLEK